MANGFSIVIAATDNASKTLGMINRSLGQVQAPAKRLQGEMTKFGNLTGLTKVKQGFEGIVRSSIGAARSVADVLEPVAVLTSAASIGGFAALIEKWSALNTSLGFAAQAMGVLPQQLGQIRAAGALAGGSADAMQAGFQNLGQTLYDVRNGGAPQMAYIMSRLGISLTDATGHARTATDVMPRLADAIARVKNPIAQARLATIAFGAAGVDMLPALRGGAAGLVDLDRQASRYGSTTSAGAAAALQFTKAQAAVSQSVLGLTDAIATQLAPVISPLLLQLAGWIASARTSKFVTHDLAEDVRDFGSWIKRIDFGNVLRDVEQFGNKVLDVLGYLDRWRTTLAGIAGTTTVGAQADIRNAHPTALGRLMYDWSDRLRGPDNALNGRGGDSAVSLPSSAAQAASAGHTIALLQSLGWSRAQAAGIAAGFQNESGFNATAVGDSGQAYGAGQWHPDRQENFRRWAGHDIRGSTLDEQIRFKNFELTQGEERQAGQQIRTAKTASEAGAFDSLFDVRPGKDDMTKIAEAGSRGRLADELFNRPPAQPTPAAAGQVAITITHDGVGKVVARSRGNVSTPRITTAMNGAGRNVLTDGY